MIYNLGKENSIINQYTSELRDINIQKDSMRFRKNLKRVGALIGYEISKKLEYTVNEVVTQLGVANVPTLTENPVLGGIMRAGIPLHEGLLSIFDKSDNAFISAYRKYRKNGTFDIQIEYLSSPDLSGKTLILADPMMATGQSMLLAYKELINRCGQPAHTHFVSVLASSEGVDVLKKSLPNDTFSLWVCAIDDELTAQAYIVPGLGDAGDLAYGKK